MPRTSVGQALANALAAWLRKSLGPDVTVYAHWPAADVRLKKRVVSVVPVGRRTRNDATGVYVAGQTNTSPTQTTVRFQIGGVQQPLQLDVWTTSQTDRDDVIARLDDVLYAGIPETLNVENSTQYITGDPMRDGVLLELADGFEGSYGDFWFDDADIEDTAESIQRNEYRATFLGEGRTAFTVTRSTARIVSTELKLQVTQAPEPPSVASLPYATTTLTLSEDDPPAVIVTHGTSTS